MQNVMFGPMTLYEAFAYFFIYAFLGWVVEVAFHAITAGKFINRGFLNGPVCPIYGVGVTAILLMLGDLVEKPWVVALVGLAFPTLIELITGWVLDKLFHNKWWDYSDRKFNLKGYICLEFSLLWALAVVAVIEVVHPGIKWLVALPDNIVGTVIVSIFIALMVADLIVTVLQVLKLNRKLKELDEIAQKMRVGSDFIGKHIADATIKVEGGLERAKAKREAAIDAVVGKMPKRLLKAFPKLASRTNPDSVKLANESIERGRRRKKADKHIGAADPAPVAADNAVDTPATSSITQNTETNDRPDEN